VVDSYREKHEFERGSGVLSVQGLFQFLIAITITLVAIAYLVVYFWV